MVFNFSLELKFRNPFAKQCTCKVGGFTIETYSVGNCSIRSFRDKFDYITFLRTAQRSVSSKKFYNFWSQYFSQCSFIGKINDIFSITAKIWYKGSPPYAFFGTWKKPCYMKLVLVGLYCGPLLTLIPPLTRT